MSCTRIRHGDVEDLHAAADRENGQVAPPRLHDERDFEFVAPGSASRSSAAAVAVARGRYVGRR